MINVKYITVNLLFISFIIFVLVRELHKYVHAVKKLDPKNGLKKTPHVDTIYTSPLPFKMSSKQGKA